MLNTFFMAKHPQQGIVFAITVWILIIATKEKLWRNPFLSDCSGIRTRNCLVRKPTFNQLAKLAKWSSCVMKTHLHGGLNKGFYYVT